MGCCSGDSRDYSMDFIPPSDRFGFFLGDRRLSFLGDYFFLLEFFAKSILT